MERQKVKKMTFKEKLQMEHPEIKTAKECKCPSDYGYEGYATKVDCLLGNCEACWNREIPFEDTKDYWYKKGLNDAWELALKFSKMDDSEREKVFDCSNDTFFFDKEWMTPQEALAKLKAYEEEQNKIEVGDVVEGEEGIFVVSNIIKLTESTTYYGITRDGKLMRGEDVKKTGKHIDIKSILEQIRG